MVSSDSSPVIHRLEELISEPSREFGTVISMTYDEAVVATTDAQVRNAGGVPQRCFLLAVPTPEDENENVDELVLLSVKTVVPLESGRSYTTLREELALSSDHSPDLRTRRNLEQLAFSCNIVGTFYRTDEGLYRFGGDIDRVRANALFKVYRPRGRSLSLIASYSHGSAAGGSMTDALDLGFVRYSETSRMPDPDSRVFVNIEDFIGKKTAVFGMSRTGKSNTMKTVIQKIFQYTRLPGQKPVGQLIFDPQGEYANVNSQDDFNALANIGTDDEVAIYRMLGGKKENAKERHLQFNLFADENLDLTWSLMTGELRSGISGDANYIQPLFELSFHRPDSGANQDAWGAFKRKQLALYALMGRSRFHSEVKDFNLYVGKELASRIVEAVKEVELTEGREDSVTISSTYASVEVFEWLIDQYGKQNRWWREAGGCPEFLDRDLKDGLMYEIGRQFAQMDEGRNGVMGAFNRIKPLHSTSAQGDVRAKIWRDLEAGKLIIVDLSKGSQRTTTTLSEMIVRYLVNEASKIFTSGLPTVPFQIVVEEAHNLFRREGQKDSSADPWVRLSKEAAKYSIGLLYATQEVTGVDPQILSNTANWIVAHLNSRTELSELAKYYSFGEWSDHLLKVEAKGFVRLKTESSPYIVPVQIDRFVAGTPAPDFVTEAARADVEATIADLPKAETKPLKKAPPVTPDPPAYTDEEIENLF